MRKKFRIMLFFLIVMLVILIIIGVAYLFHKNMDYTKAVIETDGSLSINYEDGNKVEGKNKQKIKFKVINSSTEKEYYYIEFKNIKNNNKKVKFNLNGDNKLNVSDNLNNYDTVISSYIPIDSGKTTIYTLEVEPDDNKKYQFEINVKSESLESHNFSEVILKNNEIKDNPTTAIGSASTNDEGLIKNTDDYGTTYYFRGNVQNNNVKINDLLFKIVRINGDGSVKLVLNDKAELSKVYTKDTNKIDFRSSLVYSYLVDEWLNKNLRDYNYYLSNQKYCNEISVDNGKYLSYKRIVEDNIPSFICLGDKVSSKVGLLTADEIIYAGGSLNEDNTNYYLYNSNISENVYTMTSSAVGDHYNAFMLSNTGRLLLSSNAESNAIRPVISIIKTAQIDGDGTKENPYVIIDKKK